VLLDHLREVHPVHVVGTHDDDDVRLVVVDQVQGLVDRVRAAEVPVLAEPLLGRHRRDVVAEQCRHPPGRGHVAVEGVGLVLGEDDDPQVAAVHDVREREVDQPVDPCERHRRLRPVGGQRHQPLALTTGQHDGQDPFATGGAHARHRSEVRGQRSSVVTLLGPVRALACLHDQRRPWPRRSLCGGPEATAGRGR